jgi:hypothetical protein
VHASSGTSGFSTKTAATGECELTLSISGGTPCT